MDDASISRLAAGIRDVPDFPKPGILFKDITPVLADHALWNIATEAILETAAGEKVSKVIGIDARGFIFGAVAADRLGAGFVPIRKAGKLPHFTEQRAYALEYGEAEVEIHRDAIAPDENVLIVDDLLATGGTARAAAELVTQLGGHLIGISFLIELTFLNGRAKLEQFAPVHSILKY